MKYVSFLLVMVLVFVSSAADGVEIDGVSSASRQYNLNGGTAYEDYADINWYAGYSNGQVFFSYGTEQGVYSDTIEFLDVSRGNHDETIPGLTAGTKYYFNLWASWYGRITSAKGTFTTSESGVITFTLDVENGSGSGEFEAGESVTITAKDSTGFLFDTWIGDTEVLSEVTEKVTSFTMPEKNVTLTATFVEVDIPVDTTNPSKEFIVNQSWGIDIDSFGSEVDTGDGLIKEAGVKASLTIVASDTGDAGSDDDKWAYGSVACWLPEDGSSLDGADYIKLVYKTDDKFELVLPQEGLSEAGESYNKDLTPTAGDWKSVVWKLDDKAFTQPSWVSSKTALDLSKVSGLSFAMQNDNASGTIEIKEVVLYNYSGTYASEIGTLGHNVTSSAAMTFSKKGSNLSLVLPVQQTGTLEIISTTGRVLFSDSRTFVKGKNSLSGVFLSQGLYVVRFTGEFGTQGYVQKLLLK